MRRIDVALLCHGGLGAFRWASDRLLSTRLVLPYQRLSDGLYQDGMEYWPMASRVTRDVGDVKKGPG